MGQSADGLGCRKHSDKGRERGNAGERWSEHWTHGARCFVSQRVKTRGAWDARVVKDGRTGIASRAGCAGILPACGVRSRQALDFRGRSRRWARVAPGTQRACRCAGQTVCAGRARHCKIRADAGTGLACGAQRACCGIAEGELARQTGIILTAVCYRAGPSSVAGL